MAYPPSVHYDLVRNSLPGMPGSKVGNVADDEIADYIQAATRMCVRRGGVPQTEEAKQELEYIIKLFAKADTLERSLSEQGVAEVPLATAWRTRANTQLDSYDAETSGEGETSKKAAEVANVFDLAPEELGVFSPFDLGVGPFGTPGAEPRRDIAWYPYG